MALLGTAVLCVWNDVDPSIETDYNDWYRAEHIPERLAVPGMKRARRYKADAGSPRYMALYEAESIDVLTSGAYRTQLANPTPWTRRVMPGFRLMQRGICKVVTSSGSDAGQAALIAHIRPDPGAEDVILTWARALPAAMSAASNVSAVHVWAVAPGEPASPTTTLTQSAAIERPVHWVVMVEATDIRDLAVVRQTLLSAAVPGAMQAYPEARLIATVTP